MSSSAAAFEAIASDLGVKRYERETEESFFRRVAYSASRSWVMAFCMDDGEEGKRGMSKQAIARRLSRWVAEIDSIYPGLAEWFAPGKGSKAIYNRMIDVGDLMPNGFEGTYLAAPAAKIQVTSSAALVVGFFDPSSRDGNVCGIPRSELVCSGLGYLAVIEGEPIEMEKRWWLAGERYFEWERSSDFEGVLFANPKTTQWNVNHADVWREQPEWVDGITLARVEGTGVDPMLFLALKKKSQIYLTKINWIQAQRLFFYLRSERGNPAVARFARLDKRHVRLVSPIGFLPGCYNRILDAVGWPIGEIAKRNNRIVRTEALPLVEDLLKACNVGLKESSNG